MNLEVAPRVWPELVSSLEWYTEQQDGLAAELMDAIRRTIREVASSPYRFPVIHLGARRAQVNRFPFGVFFIVLDDTVHVFAICHLQRNPNHWQRHIPRKPKK